MELLGDCGDVRRAAEVLIASSELVRVASVVTGDGERRAREERPVTTSGGRAGAAGDGEPEARGSATVPEVGRRVVQVSRARRRVRG